MPLAPLASLEKICWGLRFRKWLRDQGTETVPYFPTVRIYTNTLTRPFRRVQRSTSSNLE